MSDDETRRGGDKGRPPRRRRRRTQGGARPSSGETREGRASADASGGRERRSRRRRRSTATDPQRANESGAQASGSPAPSRRGRRRGRRTRGEGGAASRSSAQSAPTPGGDAAERPPRSEVSESPDHARDRAEPIDAPSEVADHAPAATDDSPDAPPAARGPAYDFGLPADPPADDPDPVTAKDAELGAGEDEFEAPSAQLSTSLCDVVGVKFAAAGKIYVYESEGDRYARGEPIVVEGDRGPRLGTVAVATHRRAGKQPQRRALRRPSSADRKSLERGAEHAAEALAIARSRAAELKLPIKVYRVEPALAGNKLVIYFSSEKRIDFRELVRELARQLKSKIEMRQTGVRDEAKMVGGIGSCGQELCCTTWLPSFVPVSIKMAKDQGMVLNPTKVAGQCGRLKCCLVYEQSTYAEMRKGLPKVGKRVITDDGEGRVVEVDVLHQRVRVSLEGGQFHTYAAAEVRAKFPPQQTASSKGGRAT